MELLSSLTTNSKNYAIFAASKQITTNMKSLNEATRDELFPIVNEIMSWSIDPMAPSPNMDKALETYTELKGMYEDDAARIIMEKFVELKQ